MVCSIGRAAASSARSTTSPSPLPRTSCCPRSRRMSGDDGDGPDPYRRRFAPCAGLPRELVVMPLILIVDDSPTELHVMQTALEKHGYRTAAAADGAEGVRLAREMSPDLIFMDIVMPGMNGYQATRALANDPKTRTIPIIMVTSKGQETDRIWGLRQGAVDYMIKPVSPDQLVAKAQATLSG